MIDFIVKYWIEFLFGLIISGMGVMAKLMYNQHLKNKAIGKGVEALLEMVSFRHTISGLRGVTAPYTHERTPQGCMNLITYLAEMMLRQT